MTSVGLRKKMPAEIGVAAVLLVVFAYLAWRLPDFRTTANLRLLAKQVAQLAIVSTGMTLVIATGGIDISVGSLVGLCSMTLGWLCAARGWPLPAACAGAVAVGALCGLGNGLLIAGARLPPIIVTLATFAAARAGASMFNSGESISDLPRALNETFDRIDIAGLP